MYKPRRMSYRRRTWLLHPLFILWMLFCLSLGIYSFAMASQWSADELTKDGYTNVEMGEWVPFSWACQKAVANRFTGVQNGQQRSGVVCTSIFYSYVVTN